MTKTNDPDFLGDPEDEALAGQVYDLFPRFEAGNQVNRSVCVHLIAEAIRAEREACAKVAERFQEQYSSIPIHELLLPEAIRQRWP